MGSWRLSRTDRMRGKESNGERVTIQEGCVKSLEPDRLKSLSRSILGARQDEIGCAECFRLLDRFVDLHLAGKSAAEALPLVQQHLERCRECREEFDALLAAVIAAA